jgi:hypothetical protein
MQNIEIAILAGALVLGYSFFMGITWAILPPLFEDSIVAALILCILWPIVLPALIAAAVVRWLQHHHKNRVPQARIIKKG